MSAPTPFTVIPGGVKARPPRRISDAEQIGRQLERVIRCKPRLGAAIRDLIEAAHRQISGGAR